MDKQYTITEIAIKHGVNRHTLQLAAKKCFGDRIKAWTTSHFTESEIPVILAQLKTKNSHIQYIKSINGDIAIISIDGHDVYIDKEDIKTVMKVRWVLKRDKIPYIVNYSHKGNGKTNKTYSLFLHRYLLNAQKSELIDHINMNTLDNRKCNLRFCSKSDNSCNVGKRKTNTSGYKGVSWDNRQKKWRAVIVKNRKQIHIGYFSNPETAYAAYREAAKRLHGEFARFA
jgi:hypothetical protein